MVMMVAFLAGYGSIESPTSVLGVGARHKPHFSFLPVLRPDQARGLIG